MERHRRAEESTPRRVEIHNLLGKQLRMPLVAGVQATHPGFMAHTEGIAILGYGDDAAEAVEALKEGIEGICQNQESIDLRCMIQRMLLLDKLHGG